MQCKILFEEQESTHHDVVWEYKHPIHIQVDKQECEEAQPESGYTSSNKLKIHYRDSLRENFSYEIVFHVLAKLANLENSTFSLFYFEETEDLFLLELICMHLNRYYGQSLQLEIGDGRYVLKSGEDVLLESFF